MKTRILINGCETKTYGPEQKVFLKNETEYSFWFYNDSNTKYAIGICIDGKIQSKRLVLNPYETVNLERWFDSNNKFKFKTYETIKGGPGEDILGKIKLQFYAEKVKMYFTYTEPFKQYGGFNNCTNVNWSTSNTISCANSASNTISVGHTEKGSHSDQQFQTSCAEFELFESMTHNFWLLPEERFSEFVSANKIRNYCSSCGRRLKQGWKFCAGCGTKT